VVDYASFTGNRQIVSNICFNLTVQGFLEPSLNLFVLCSPMTIADIDSFLNALNSHCTITTLLNSVRIAGEPAGPQSSPAPVTPKSKGKELVFSLRRLKGVLT